MPLSEVRPLFLSLSTKGLPLLPCLSISLPLPSSPSLFLLFILSWERACGMRRKLTQDRAMEKILGASTHSTGHPPLPPMRQLRKRRPLLHLIPPSIRATRNLPPTGSNACTSTFDNLAPRALANILLSYGEREAELLLATPAAGMDLVVQKVSSKAEVFASQKKFYDIENDEQLSCIPSWYPTHRDEPIPHMATATNLSRHAS